MQSVSQVDFGDELPTQREYPSGRFIVAIDRAGRKLEAVLACLDDGQPLDDAMKDELRAAQRLLSPGGGR